MSYQQLTLEERAIISGFCKAGFSISEIAHELNRHKSTISREILRNTGKRGYRPKQANEMAVPRRKSPYKAIKWKPEIEDEVSVIADLKLPEITGENFPLILYIKKGSPLRMESTKKPFRRGNPNVQGAENHGCKANASQFLAST